MATAELTTVLERSLSERPRAAGCAPTAYVLHLINGEHYSGAERVQDLLALRLPEQGFEVGFVCLKPDRFPAMRQSRNVPLVPLAMRGRWDVRSVARLVRLIRREGYGLVHTHTPRTALIGGLAAALARVPLIHHLHSPTTADSTHRLRNRINAVIERASLWRAARVIAVSHSLGDYARRQRIAAEKISVVPNGVPAVPWVSRRTPAGEWTLGTVALFRPRKGMEVLLEALALLRTEGLPVRLRAVGGFETGDYERDIREQALGLGLEPFIDWTGFTTNVAEELARMDLFVLPSLFGEGLPMVVLEAMTSGVPVVATRVEGIPEAIRDGIDGIIAEPRNAADLARQIARVVRGEVDWQELRCSARQRHADLFSDGSMAAGVADVYREVLAS